MKWMLAVVGVAIVAAAIAGIALSVGTCTFVAMLVAAGPCSAFAAWALYTEVVADRDRYARPPDRPIARPLPVVHPTGHVQ
jgi:hypothetical protein